MKILLIKPVRKESFQETDKYKIQVFIFIKDVFEKNEYCQQYCKRIQRVPQTKETNEEAKLHCIFSEKSHNDVEKISGF